MVFSTTYAPDESSARPEEGQQAFSDSLEGRWRAVSFVNPGWLDVVASDEAGSLVEVPAPEVPKPLLGELVAWFDQVWARPGSSAEQTVARLKFLTSTGTVPVMDIAGELDYRDDVLLIVVPNLAGTFNDRTLTDFATGRDLLIADVDATQRLVESFKLAKGVKVRQAAEEGVLLTQFAKYEAWLGVVAIVGLGIALAISAAISAYIASMLQARSDFVRRLSGHSWARVLSGRLVPEIVIGAVIAVAALVIQPSERVVAVLAAAVLLLAASPVVHVLAARRAFADVTARRL